MKLPWSVILAFFIVNMIVAGDPPKKQKAEPVDSTSTWIKRTDAIKFLQNKREEMKLQYIQQDASIAGQIEAFSLITQDSVKIKK